MRFRRRAGAAVVLTAAGLATGCGSAAAPPPDPATVQAGARVYSSSGCGTCHTLSAAGSRGRVGPSLDGGSLLPEAVAARVRSGGGGMPAFAGRLSEREIEAVAAYVAESSKR